MRRLVILAMLLACAPAVAQNSPGVLSELEISANFEKTGFDDVLNYFANVTKVDIVMDPTWKQRPPLTLVLNELNARTALFLILRLADSKLTYDARWGGVFIGTKERLEFLPKEVPGDAEGLDKKVNVNFDQTPLADVLKFLRSVTGAEIEVTKEAIERVKTVAVSVRCRQSSLRDTLSRIIFPSNLAWEVKGGKIRVIPAMEKKKKEESPEDAARRTLKEKTINIEFRDTSIVDAVSFFARYASINIHLDPVIHEQRSKDELLVNLHANDISVANALKLLTLTKNLNYDFRWGGVFIAHPDRLKTLSKATIPPPAEDMPDWERKLRKQLEGAITFSFAEATVSQGLDFIRTLKGVNLVLTPEAQKAAEGARLTLTVNAVALSDALALILIPRGLKMELRNEIVLVSVPE